MERICNYAQIKRSNNVVRLFSAKVSPNLKLPTPSAHCDLIGPPDPISNIRPIIVARSENESKLEKIYREAREDTQTWNQHFWTKHNIRFIKERKQFQENLKKEGKTSITADDMSVFYKEFLDKNWHTHFNYNIAWYRRNIKLLFLEFGVRISKLKFR
ncbi:APOPT family protein CG14806, mitochondrial [Ceratina calcarata]|uniref:APOPT family protein CG14806, mitochondrial n=1 Tax=Ceratina calcarata TaxID=156304 RepID=A0AAJ7IZ01_9HYME|nr:APOPT family protein CG14806, mitochondrial [Ceratina calcarata]